ncbi:hypothetical protein CMUS01_05439 [Colletotrichum musicola]|uniref:Uncharacterized protein n=1 Tax=Colletotrichum musicola TaxID=2175873 RepID=A0A8H6KRH1_9PEZI|nr:hypothetical protein CMUS01_05439 [Colletotrichum musicola]
MQYSVILFFLVSLLSAFVFAYPTASSAEGGSAGRASQLVARGVRRLDAREPLPQQGNGQTGASQGQNNTAGGRNGVSDAQVMNAVMSWMQDTGKVTKFLNSATSFTGAEFTKQATIALNAEIDELNHKMVLDAALTGMDMVAQANNVLATQGTFQQVVDTLQSMVTNGPDTAQRDVDSINNNRCVNVLPNIDMYFAAAGMPQIQAVRPTGCLEVEGANVTPAVPPPAGGNNGGNNGGAAAPPPPQVTTPPNNNGGQNQGNNNNQGNNQNQGNNGNDQTQNQGNGNNNGNGNDNTQNQNQGNNGNNQNQGNNGSNQNQGNNGNNQNQGNNGNNQNQGNNGNNQSQGQGQNNNNIGKGIGNNNGNGQNQNQNQGNNNNQNQGNSNGNGNRGSNGARPQNQNGGGLQPAQLGSPRPANN